MKKGEIDIDGVIGWEVTARQVKRELKEMGAVDELDVYMNSPGGFIDDGFGTFTAIKNHAAVVNMHITGMAASMGSVIAMAGDLITIEPVGMMMIHPPASIAWGTAAVMRDEADVLDQYEKRITTAYERRGKALNLSSEELREAIEKTTWYTAQEALDAGFVDGIEDRAQGSEPEEQLSTAATEWLRVAQYKNTPDAFLNRPASRRNLKAVAHLGGSAVSTEEGKTMPDYTEAEHKTALDAAVKTAIQETKETNAQALKDAKAEGRKDALEDLNALMEHENSSNGKATVQIAQLDIDMEQKLAMMDNVKPADGSKKSNALTKEQEAEIARKAIDAARAEASNTTNVATPAGTSNGDLEDAEAAAAALAEADNKRRAG